MKEKYIVHITTDTVRGILLEKSRHPQKECIVQMAGIRKKNHFYFDMVADSGIHATYEYAMCEKDHEYADHLTTRLSEYYEIEPKELTVSQLHFHPNGCHHFSKGDGPANLAMARTYGGAVMGLGFVDPKFRIRFWYIDENGNEYPAEVVMDNGGVARAMPRKELNKLRKLVEDKEASVRNTSILPKRKMDLLKKYPEFTKELSEISMREEIFVEKQEDGALKLTINITENEKVQFHAKREWHRLILTIDDKKRLYRKGVVKEMLIEKKREYIARELDEWVENNATYTVYMPQEYKDSRYEGELFGYFHKDSKTYNVVHHEVKDKLSHVELIGEIMENRDVFSMKENLLLGVWGEDDKLHLRMAGKENTVEVKFYSYLDEAFSRNEKILKMDAMKHKQAIIPGVGSGGSFIALELAKAGIGSLVIADDDIFAYHNISRHQCGIHDVGKFKVEAIRERIHDINPYCKVHTFHSQIQQVDPEKMKELVTKDSMIICCTDNRHAAYVCNELAKEYQIPMIDAGCGPRASTGEVFYWKPGMPDYESAYGEDVGVDYTNQQVRRMFYATESELEKMSFQPGMSLDINLTSVFAAKLAVDLLMENEEGYEFKLLPFIYQCTIIVNYPVDEEVNPYMKLFKNRKPFEWKSGNVARREEDGGVQADSRSTSL